MSRNRRNRGESAGDPLENFDTGVLPSADSDLSGMSTSQFASAGYNSLITDFESVGRGKVTAKPLEIDRIYPDPSQPRRTIPSELRQKYWNGRPDAPSMAFLFEKWLTEIQLENSSQAFDLGAILSGTNSERARYDEDESESSVLPQMGKFESALVRIADLAASIQRDGLTNPVTVVASDTGYQIETGERRWMAFQLLRWYSNDNAEWQKIPAREVDRINIWRQASENNARADLNAIARARQLALLLIDLYQPYHAFSTFHDFKNEQEYYAQVADGSQFKVPSDKREMVLNAMGFRHPVQIRQYRALLRLPEAVWTLADDFNWAENAIQKDLLQKSDGDTEQLIQLAHEKAGLIESDRVSTLTRPSDKTSDLTASGKQSAKTAGFSRWRKDLGKLRQELDKMQTDERKAALLEIEDILRQYRSKD